MEKNSLYLSITIGAVVLIVGLIGLYGWLNRPMPIPLDDPKAQLIKNVLVKSHKLEYALFCLPESDVTTLDEVYKDTADYKLTSDHRVLISKYLGEEIANTAGAGYLTFKKAYFLWSKSGDLYPRASPDPTEVYLATVAPLPKPIRDCPDPLPEPELWYQSIAIREDKAVAVYDYAPYLLEVVLRKFDGEWFIVSSRALAITP